MFRSLLILLLLTTSVYAEDVGSVSTTFNLLTPNDKIKVEAFEDPQVKNATCFVSYASTWLADNPSRFSIACRAVGPITVNDISDDWEEVFSQSQSIFFKSLKVVRKPYKNTIVYLAYSTKLLDGSPYNSVSAIVRE